MTTSIITAQVSTSQQVIADEHVQGLIDNVQDLEIKEHQQPVIHPVTPLDHVKTEKQHISKPSGITRNTIRPTITHLSPVEKKTWDEFLDFMDSKAKENPYRKLLYRAHSHGYPQGRFQDKITNQYCDTFGSDYHLSEERKFERHLDHPVNDPVKDYTMVEFHKHLSDHLNKTWLATRPIQYRPPPSNFVSLSADFRWTAQRACQNGKTAPEKDDGGNDKYIPGLAIFNTSIIQSHKNWHIWRVSDIEEFFLGTTSPIDRYLCRWARNAEEYVCWGLIPQNALISFTRIKDLIQPPDANAAAFLTSKFVHSEHLWNFKQQQPKENISLEEYTNRAINLVRQLLLRDCADGVDLKEWYIDELTRYLTFNHGLDWGYIVSGSYEEVKESSEAMETQLKEELLL